MMGLALALLAQADKPDLSGKVTVALPHGDLWVITIETSPGETTTITTNKTSNVSYEGAKTKAEERPTVGYFANVWFKKDSRGVARVIKFGVERAPELPKPPSEMPNPPSKTERPKSPAGESPATVERPKMPDKPKDPPKPAGPPPSLSGRVVDVFSFAGETIVTIESQDSGSRASFKINAKTQVEGGVPASGRTVSVWLVTPGKSAAARVAQ